MATLLETADDVLRRAAWTIRADASARTLLRLLVCVAAFAFMYGAAMGLFRGMTGQSQWALQMLYSAIKAPLLLVGSFAVSLPTFFVLSTLFGLRHDFARAVRALVDGALFAIASIAGQWILRAHFRPLIERNRRHRQLLIAWGVAYVFVAIQLAWLLRPFLGSSGMEVTFLREEAWDNAYVVVAWLVWEVLFGG
jgi:hypothetical protein